MTLVTLKMTSNSLRVGGKARHAPSTKATVTHGCLVYMLLIWAWG